MSTLGKRVWWSILQISCRLRSRCSVKQKKTGGPVEGSKVRDPSMKRLTCSPCLPSHRSCGRPVPRRLRRYTSLVPGLGDPFAFEPGQAHFDNRGIPQGG